MVNIVDQIKEGPKRYILIFLIVILLTAFAEVHFGYMGVGDFFVGSATLFLAGATFSLVWGEIENSKKERIRDRLKERLEKLYSPLMGLGDNFEQDNQHNENLFEGEKKKRDETSVLSIMANIKNVYSYLASNALRIQLDLYYKDYFFPKHVPNSNTLKALRAQFTADFEEIAKEYRQLTISEAEKKRRIEIFRAKKEMKNPK